MGTQSIWGVLAKFAEVSLLWKYRKLQEIYFRILVFQANLNSLSESQNTD